MLQAFWAVFIFAKLQYLATLPPKSGEKILPKHPDICQKAHQGPFFAVKQKDTKDLHT
jgi:hypothetical protein